MNDPRLDYLLDRYFDEALTAEECAELDRAIIASPRVREVFWERQRFHARLRQWGEQAWGAERAEEKPTQTDSKVIAWLRHRPTAWLAAAACAAAAVSAWLWLRPLAPRTERTTSAVAVLTQAVEAQWEAGAEAPTVGASIPPGWVRLKSGMVQLEFISGARVILEGPAAFQIRSPMEGFCESGKLSAEVPPQAHGFTVHAPGATVVDVGTAFGMNVTPKGAAEVQVLRGEIQLHQAARQRGLQEGQSVRVEADGRIQDIAELQTSFPSPEELAQRANAEWKRRREEWLKAMAHFESDPALAIHYTFENSPSWSRVLRNAIASASNATNGAVVGCNWTDGRWPGKRALEFHGVNDRVRFALPGDFEAITLSAWVRIDGIDLDLNGIMMTDGWERGELHWQVTRTGAVRLGLSGAQNYDFDTPPVFTRERLGEWVHLAVICDPVGKREAHYVNGQEIASRPLSVNFPLRIGEAELGDWNPLTNRSRPIRNLNGRMDEFCLFTRALNPAEIQSLYNAGRGSF